MPVGAHLLIAGSDMRAVTKLQKRPHARGYSIAGRAFSGEGAIEAAASAQLALMRLDIRLTGFFDRTQTAEQIRPRFNIPVVCVTECAGGGTLRGANLRETFRCVRNPFETGELIWAIAMALCKHRMERRLKKRKEWLATAREVCRRGGDGHAEKWGHL